MARCDRARGARGSANLLGLWLLFEPSLAKAGPPDAVVLLRVPDADQRAAERRVQDELRMAGLHVEEVRDPCDDAVVEHLIAERGAHAAVRFERSGGASVIWLNNAPGGAASTVQRIVATTSDGTMIALKAAELIQSRLSGLQAYENPQWIAETGASGERVEPDLENSLVPPVSPPPWKPPPQTLPATSSRPTSGISLESPATQTRTLSVTVPRWDEDFEERDLGRQSVISDRLRPRVREAWTGASLMLAGDPRGGHILVGAAAMLGYRLTPLLSAQVEVFALTWPRDIPVTNGSIRFGYAGGQVIGVLRSRRDRRVTPRLRGGTGFGLAWARGDATGTVRDHTELAVVGVITIGVGLAVRVHPHLRLQAALDAQFLLPPVGVRGVDEVGLGLPILQGSIGLEWTRRPRVSHFEKR